MERSLKVIWQDVNSNYVCFFIFFHILKKFYNELILLLESEGKKYVKNISSMTVHCLTGKSTNSSAPVPSGSCLPFRDLSLPLFSDTYEPTHYSCFSKHCVVFQASRSATMLFFRPEMPPSGFPLLLLNSYLFFNDPSPNPLFCEAFLFTSFWRGLLIRTCPYRLAFQPYHENPTSSLLPLKLFSQVTTTNLPSSNSSEHISVLLFEASHGHHFSSSWTPFDLLRQWSLIFLECSPSLNFSFPGHCHCIFSLTVTEMPVTPASIPWPHGSYLAVQQVWGQALRVYTPPKMVCRILDCDSMHIFTWGDSHSILCLRKDPVTKREKKKVPNDCPTHSPATLFTFYLKIKYHLYFYLPSKNF